MRFVETPYFSRFWDAHCGGDALAELQQLLAERPEAGVVIKGTRGMRKLRWALPGRGKSGGARVIYFWRNASGTIYLLHAFAKGAQSDLTDSQRKSLARWINMEFGDE